jgi:membrane-associated phospholipid phosphatase
MAIETKAKYVFTWLITTSIVYFSVQAVVSDTYSFLNPLDEGIPFIPEFIWLYHTLVPVIVGTTIFSMHRRRVFFNTIAALTFSMAALTCFHLIFPSYYPRQELLTGAGSSVSLWLVEITRQFDAACNTFPSGHVTFSWIIYFCARMSDNIKRTNKLIYIYLLWTILISISTLVLKQHYIFDVISGIILAYISVMVGCAATNRYMNVEVDA